MDILLGKWNREPGRVKALFDLTGEIPIHAPVILRLRPGPADEVHGRVGQFIDPNRRFGIIENQWVLGNRFFEDFLRHGDIISITDTENQIYAPRRQHIDVGNNAAPNLIVGYNDHLIVKGLDCRGHNAGVFHGAGYACGIDKITHIERFW